LHWSLTQFTPASMEVVPQTVGERVYTVNVILFAMIAFSSFVSLLTASMTQLQNLSSSESRQFWLLRRYFKDWGVRRHVAIRVQRYLEYAYARQRQRVQDSEVKLLSLLSETLRLELKHETFSQYLRGHPLFKLCCENPRIFGKALSASHWAIGDLLFMAGHEGDRMSFLTSGAMEYTLGIQHDDALGDDSPRHKTLPNSPREQVWEGCWVAEACLWSNWRYMGDLQAMTECQVIEVNSVNFGESVQMHAPTWAAVRKYAARFVMHLNETDDEDLTDLTDQMFSASDCVDKDDFFFLDCIGEDEQTASRYGRLLAPFVAVFDIYESWREWARNQPSWREVSILPCST